MTQNNLFSHNQFYIQFKAPNADELTSYVMSKEEEYTEFPWAETCKLKTISCPWQEIEELMKPSIEVFAQHLGKTFSYGFDDAWISCYENGSFQETHDHLEWDFSSVFFPQQQEADFGRFYFYDRYYNSLTSKWRQLFNTFSSWVPNHEPGDIIFFPSTILHGVTVHRSDKIRKTFSCNYYFDLSNNE